MSTESNPRHGRRSSLVKVSAGSALTLAVAAGLILTFSGVAQAASAVGLGTADSFGVLAGSGITNTGPTTVNGDLGTFPTTTISDLGALTINGVNHAGDAVTQGAKNDLVTAYDAVAAQPTSQSIVADLGGTTLVSGVYTSASSIGLTGTVTLDAAGNSDAVFIFKAGSTLITASGSRVALVNGAQACNVFWQVGSSATLGTTTSFKGNILALTSITLNTSATVEGRVLARDGAVTLDSNTVSRPGCTRTSAGAVPPPVLPYAANIGPLAQGLVCPWGGQYNNEGLCFGSEPNPLTNASASPTPSASRAPIPSPSTSTPTAVSATPTAVSATPIVLVTPKHPGRSPIAQVPRKPHGGVETGDNSN